MANINFFWEKKENFSDGYYPSGSIKVMYLGEDDYILRKGNFYTLEMRIQTPVNRESYFVVSIREYREAFVICRFNEDCKWLDNFISKCDIRNDKINKIL